MTVSTMIAALLLATAPEVTPPATTAAALPVASVLGTMRDGTPLTADTRVCIRSPRPATHIPITECQRYADWLAEGVNPAKYPRIR